MHSDEDTLIPNPRAAADAPPPQAEAEGAVFDVEAKTLLGAVATVTRTAATRDVVPVLTGIRIAALSQSLTLLGTDLEAGVEATVPAYVAQPGVFVVPARRLLELLRHVPQDAVLRVEAQQGSCRISFGRARLDLVTFPVDQYPEVTFPEGEVARLPGDAFRTAVERVAYAVSTRDDMLTVLLGISVKLGEGIAELTASDNFRLAWCRIRGVAGPESPTEFIVRGRLLAELLRLAPADEVVVSLEERRVGLAMGQVRTFAQRIAGTFPDHRQLLEKAFPTRLRFSVPMLLQAAERAALMADSHNPQIWLRLSPNEGAFLRAESADGGSAYEPLEGEVEGEEMELAFQPRYLIEALRNLDAEEALFSFSGPGSTATLVPSERPDDQLAIVLPLRV